jgi:molecular chaperone GrpE
MDEESPDQAAPSSEVPPGKTTTAGATTDTSPGAATPSLEERLAAAEALATQHYEAYLRSRADAENMRRRAQEDVARAHKFALESFAGELLPVKDSLEATLSVSNASLESLRSGVELTLKQLTAAFEKANLREINPVGEKFDPHRHQAISSVPADQEPNTVVTVLQKGYSLAERTIRPALVTVAKTKDS